jgi:hypothetical protein
MGLIPVVIPQVDLGIYTYISDDIKNGYLYQVAV